MRHDLDVTADPGHGADGTSTVATVVDDGPERGVPATVGDRFDLGERLGRGATATVYRAHDRLLQRDVAVKLFAPGVGTLDSASVRREMQAAAQVSHPGVLEVFDVGEVDDRVFLVTRLVPGGSLADTLERGGALPTEVVVGLAGELLAALAHVHTLGIVHRDVKPANILLDHAEDLDDQPHPGDAPARVHPVLADFGVAAVATATTVHGQVTGTAAYLAPEQVRGGEVGSPADVYALGLVLLECLTGRREFPGGPVESSVARLHRDPTVPDGLPDDLRSLLTAMTASTPVERPSAEAARERLRALAPLLGLDEETLAVPAAALAASPSSRAARSPIVLDPVTAAAPTVAGRTAVVVPHPAPVPAVSAPLAAAAPGVVTRAPEPPTGPVAVSSRGAPVRRTLLAAAAVLALAGGVVGGVVLTGNGSPLPVAEPAALPPAAPGAAPPAVLPTPAPPPADPAAPTAPSDDPAAAGVQPVDTGDAGGDDADGGDAPLPQPPAPVPAPGAPPAPAPPAPCRSVVSSIAGAGATVRIVFTNRGDAACTLQGFPAVRWYAGKKAVGKPASKAEARGAAATLAPGGSASVTVTIVPVSGFDAKNCEAVATTGLRVRAPGTTVAATLPRAGKACSGTVAMPQLTVTSVGAFGS